MPRARSTPDLDRELADLPPAQRWQAWMRRIEAVLFASAAPVARADLARVVGRDAPVDLLVADLAADLLRGGKGGGGLDAAYPAGLCPDDPGRGGA